MVLCRLATKALWCPAIISCTAIDYEYDEFNVESSFKLLQICTTLLYGAWVPEYYLSAILF